MCEPRVVNVTIDMPAKSLLSITGNDCNVYWLGEPDSDTKNSMYRKYAETLHNIADAISRWTKEE